MPVKRRVIEWLNEPLATDFPVGRLSRDLLKLVTERCSLEKAIRLAHVNKTLRAHIVDHGPWPRRVDRVRIVARPNITIENDELFTEYLHVEVLISQKVWLFRPGAVFIFDSHHELLPPEFYQLPDWGAVGRLIGKIRSCQQLSIALITGRENPWPQCQETDTVQFKCLEFFERAPRRRVSLTECLPRARMVRNFALFSKSLHLSGLLIRQLPTNVVVGNCQLSLGTNAKATMAAEALASITKRSLAKHCRWLILEDVKSSLILDLIGDLTPPFLILPVHIMDAYLHLIRAFMELARRGTSSIWRGDKETHLVLYFTGPSTEMATFAKIDECIWRDDHFEAIDERSPLARRYFDSLFLDTRELPAPEGLNDDDDDDEDEDDRYVFEHRPELVNEDWIWESAVIPDLALRFDVTQRCFYRRREPAQGKEFLIANIESLCEGRMRRIGFYMRATKLE